jgi:hypothetical protein
LKIAVSEVVKEIEKSPSTPFHIVVSLDFTNSHSAVAGYIQKFISGSKLGDDLQAIYTETNGFDINPDEWYFELFGFNNCGTTDDLEWLCDWQAESEYAAVLTGMEELQKVYASEAFQKPEYTAASELCSLLIVLKFQKLIFESAKLIENLSVPIFATAHDYDFIYKYQQIA